MGTLTVDDHGARVGFTNFGKMFKKRGKGEDKLRGQKPPKTQG